MTYTFKLSRRLARVRVLLVLVTALLTGSCTSDDGAGLSRSDPLGPTGTSASEASSDEQTLTTDRGRGRRTRGKWSKADVSVSPDSVVLGSGEVQVFAVTATLEDGSTWRPRITWRASGGTIDSNGQYTAGGTPGKYRVVATVEDGSADTVATTIVEDPPTIVRVDLTPSSASVGTGATQQFTAVGRARDGSAVSIQPAYRATGGTITAEGLYTAGPVAGTYRVIATESESGLADTATMAIVAQVESVAISPASLIVEAGKSAQLTATALGADGNVLSGERFTWASDDPGLATVSSSGLVTGVAPGTVRISATTGDAHGSATVTVGAAPTATVAGCPAGDYVRLVNVSTVTQLSAALANAQPGDQIRLAPGTYTYSSRLEINRSGTAANRITMCGPRTAIIRNHYLNVNASYWHFKGFQIDGNSTALVGIWVSGGGRNIYDSLEIHHPRRQGMVLFQTTIANEIRHNYIHDTGIEEANRGECLYISNVDGVQRVDSTWIHHNTLEDCRSEAVELKVGSRYSLVEHNTITNAGHGMVKGSDEPIVVRSNNNRIYHNTVTTAPRYLIVLYAADGTTANNNIFRGNTGSGAGNGKMFFIQSGHSGNVVYCDNAARSPTLLSVSCSQ